MRGVYSLDLKSDLENWVATCPVLRVSGERGKVVGPPSCGGEHNEDSTGLHGPIAGGGGGGHCQLSCS